MHGFAYDLHGFFGGGAGAFCAVFEDAIQLGGVAEQLFAAAAHRLQGGVEDLGQLFFVLHTAAQASPVLLPGGLITFGVIDAAQLADHAVFRHAGVGLADLGGGSEGVFHLFGNQVGLIGDVDGVVVGLAHLAPVQAGNHAGHLTDVGGRL